MLNMFRALQCPSSGVRDYMCSNIHIKINGSEFINKIVSFLFCEFNRETSLKEGKNIFRTFIFSNCQIEILVSFSRSTNVNINMSFPISKFDGTFSTYMFGKSFLHYWDLKSECWTSRHILFKKILNFFICVEVRILCKKVKYVWSSHFPEAITTNMQIGNDSFVFEYPVTCKQKILKFPLILLKLM